MREGMKIKRHACFGHGCGFVRIPLGKLLWKHSKQLERRSLQLNWSNSIASRDLMASWPCYFWTNCAFFTCLATALTRESDVNCSLKEVPTITRWCLRMVKLSNYPSAYFKCINHDSPDWLLPTTRFNISQWCHEANSSMICHHLPVVIVTFCEQCWKKTVQSNSSPFHLVAPWFLCYAVKLLKSAVPCTKEQQYWLKIPNTLEVCCRWMFTLHACTCRLMEQSAINNSFCSCSTW